MWPCTKARLRARLRVKETSNHLYINNRFRSALKAPPVPQHTVVFHAPPARKAHALKLSPQYPGVNRPQQLIHIMNLAARPVAVPDAAASAAFGRALPAAPAWPFFAVSPWQQA